MVNETTLRQLVLDELAFDPAVEVAHIGVAVHESV
jgi:hypothetical protein